jgi:hypothetical protein
MRRHRLSAYHVQYASHTLMSGNLLTQLMGSKLADWVEGERRSLISKALVSQRRYDNLGEVDTR